MTSDVSVIPGEVLYVMVGGAGASVQADDVTDGAGGFNGGAIGGAGAGDVGAGGGGASDIRTEPNALDSRLLVAGGGGGAGATCVNCGGNGGNAGQLGTNGLGGGAGGGAGTGTAGGAGGAGATSGKGDDGTLGNGGTGQTGISGDAGGGGGGGGVYGGGGGGEGGDGGGGGGGSSYSAGSSTTITTDATGTPAIVITYPVPTADASPSTVSLTGTQPQMTMSGPKAVTVTNNGSAPLYISGWSFSGADPGDFFVGSDTCGGAVGPGSSCQLTVRFAPQASGTRSANLVIDTNALSTPSSVSLSGVGGSLPQGPKGPQGTQGQKGRQGARGPAGMIELVTCKLVTKKVNGHTHKLQKCSGRLVSGPVKFTVSGASSRATVSRRGVVYASGVSISSGHGRRGLILTHLRRALRGRYALTLGQRGHGRGSSRRVSIVIGSGRGRSGQATTCPESAPNLSRRRSLLARAGSGYSGRRSQVPRRTTKSASPA